MCAVLAAFCFVIFVPGLSHQFIWDDELYITRNPAVSAGLSLQGLRWAFSTFHAGNWHPLTWISHQTDVELFGLDPLGHHLTSLLLHAVNAVLVFLVFHRATGHFRGSALVAALFAVHPLHVESVAWVAERKDVLSTLLWLLALGGWLGWLRHRGRLRYLGAVTLYALALLAKPMPVTFPFLLLLLDWWPLGRLVPGRRLLVLAEKLPLVVLAAASGTVAYLAQSAGNTVGSVPLPIRLANAVHSYCVYIGKTILPTRLALLYPFPAEPPSLALTLLGLAVLAGTTLLVLRARRRFPELLTGWLWYAGTLVPVIGIVQIGSQARADRYTYVPLIGLFIIAARGIGALGGLPAKRSPWPAAIAVVVALLTVTARAQVGMWRDPLTAFTNAIRVTKDNRIAHVNLGVYHREHGNDRLAEEEFRAAIAIAADDVDAHSGLAQLLESQGRIEEAIAEYRAAIRGNPLLPEAYNNLGALESTTEEPEAAERNLRRALELRPDFPLAHSNLGKLLARQGRIQEALTHFREAVRLSPGTAFHHGDLGAALAALGLLDEAIPSLREALRLDPDLEIARENLARALSRRAHRR